ncbi:NAD(P)/FAD-dependent oxidoreductase [Clostridium estertheticum]|uniref:NAD(P)/FAD-dependent oxidoreductase n=1 Tax=Clostridium estertheticum TaxID=238834 RepID=A0AA47EGI4_9CLOT|nr:NAD(P)/FAD-dependent oxidoreductase [Clostridium estertheticum]MBU3156315.1 NAD(P)/FAD-dependent oxidoreductase [Clostridium estertheticum]MBU3200818.1 NAD(P)/FAD-dependent oxidoreductase [Clostridium estertheticum]WAG59788.1 NAD(P)/FAD-dependent oxidoreductase [Clostridium estertheticum]WAG66142.1 NAD(P)/FAD-dependent oxidoreductase [Clostridium estertheticum]
MEPKHAVLQKVRDGKRTYGVTPHIPGGFITPKQLSKIASVAQKYKGVLKMTSGQRIAILGLDCEDVSKVWEELGMSPAVKSLNSVKNVHMCPAAFCKRAKQNSLKIGMLLDKRYHGMEMPCRTKIGVAGCKNACTSVYSRDLGVIGDKEGYMIVAGGSGGFTPRVADIIAEKLTEDQVLILADTLITYYKDKGNMGEKLGDFITRIGLEKFKEDTLAVL